jgi:hypothetical protein
MAQIVFTVSYMGRQTKSTKRIAGKAVQQAENQ